MAGFGDTPTALMKKDGFLATLVYRPDSTHPCSIDTLLIQ
jgi:hypothetical protein